MKAASSILWLKRGFAVLGCILSVSTGTVAHAQGQAQTANPKVPSGRSEPVWLIVRPRVGDTLHLQMEQIIEITGRKAESSAPAVSPLNEGRRSPPSAKDPDYGPRRARANSRVTRVMLFAHSVVEASDLTMTTLLATTDSMAMWAGTGQEDGTPKMMPLPEEGRQVRVRVTPDGAMKVNDPPPGAMELGATLASMPGMLPSRAVMVGERWDRDIVLPSVPISGFRSDGVVHAKFRLDSIARGGREAWISMEGTLEREGAAREMPAGTRVITAGTMRGTLVVDRQRAWIVDAVTVMEVQTEVAPGPAGPATPMVLDMRIQQRLRVK